MPHTSRRALPRGEECQGTLHWPLGRISLSSDPEPPSWSLNRFPPPSQSPVSSADTFISQACVELLTASSHSSVFRAVHLWKWPSLKIKDLHGPPQPGQCPCCHFLGGLRFLQHPLATGVWLLLGWGQDDIHMSLVRSNLRFLVVDSYQRIKLLALSTRYTSGRAGGGDRQGRGWCQEGKQADVAGGLQPLPFGPKPMVWFCPSASKAKQKTKL